MKKAHVRHVTSCAHVVRAHEAAVREDEAAVAGAAVAHTLSPRDAYRQRVYLEPLGVYYLQADTCVLAAVPVNLASKVAH